MPDLAQGYSANVVLNAGESVRVSTSGQATVASAYGAPAGTTTVTSSSQLFGPYSVPVKLRVTAVTGTANYAQPVLVPATVDPSTGQLAPPASVSGAGNGGDGTVSVNNRDGQGRVISYTQAGVTYTVTYGPYGVATESGGGYIWTYNYDAAGNLTSVTKA